MIIERTNTILYCTHWQETVDFYRMYSALSSHTRQIGLLNFRLRLVHISVLQIREKPPSIATMDVALR